MCEEPTSILAEASRVVKSSKTLPDMTRGDVLAISQDLFEKYGRPESESETSIWV